MEIPMTSDAVSAARQRLEEIEKKIAEFTQKRDSTRTKAQRLKAEFDRIKTTGYRSGEGV